MSSLDKLKLFLATLCLVAGLACSPGVNNVRLQLIIENAFAPAGLAVEGLPSIQQVTNFRVTITGPDIEEPVVETLAANDATLEISDLAEGDQRTLVVEALNRNDFVVRRGQVEDLTITKEPPEPVTVSLNTVPLFTNLKEGNRIIVSRLRMLGVGEPGNSLEIDDQTTGDPQVLLNVSSSDSVVQPSMTAGDFSFLPPELSLGWHTFMIRDLDNGEKSEVRVRLVPPGSLPGTALVPFGGLGTSHVSTGGIPYNSFDTDLAHYPGVMVRSVE